MSKAWILQEVLQEHIWLSHNAFDHILASDFGGTSCRNFVLCLQKISQSLRFKFNNFSTPCGLIFLSHGSLIMWATRMSVLFHLYSHGTASLSHPLVRFAAAGVAATQFQDPRGFLALSSCAVSPSILADPETLLACIDAANRPSDPQAGQASMVLESAPAQVGWEALLGLFVRTDAGGAGDVVAKHRRFHLANVMAKKARQEAPAPARGTPGGATGGAGVGTTTESSAAAPGLHPDGGNGATSMQSRVAQTLLAFVQGLHADEGATLRQLGSAYATLSVLSETRGVGSAAALISALPGNPRVLELLRALASEVSDLSMHLGAGGGGDTAGSGGGLLNLEGKERLAAARKMVSEELDVVFKFLPSAGENVQLLAAVFNVAADWVSLAAEGLHQGGLGAAEAAEERKVDIIVFGGKNHV